MLRRAGFGGGCHWCTEAVFQSLRGVTDVKQGFIASDPPNESFSEAVDVTWDNEQITFEDLIAVHLATHSSASRHKLRGKYRSAVYLHDPSDAEIARRIIAQLAQDQEIAFITEVLPFRTFKFSDTRYHDYYATDPNRPFCEAYIEPKLALLRKKFTNLQAS